MNNNPTSSTGSMGIEPARIEQHGPLLLAGYKDRFTFEMLSTIPALWGRFAPKIGNVPNEVPGVAYGVCLPVGDESGAIEYLAAVEVTTFARLPADFVQLRVAAATYAIFEHAGHVSQICQTMDAIEREWLPRSGRQPPSDAAGLPAFFERYGPGFDPEKGVGDMEIWLPIKQ